MLDFLGGLFVDMLGALVRPIRAARRRRAVRRGEAVTIRCRLGGAGQRYQVGRLRLSPTQATWTARRDGGTVDLHGWTVHAERRVGDDDVELQLTRSGAPPVWLVVDEDDAAGLAEVLQAQRPTG